MDTRGGFPVARLDDETKPRWQTGSPTSYTWAYAEIIRLASWDAHPIVHGIFLFNHIYCRMKTLYIYCVYINIHTYHRHMYLLLNTEDFPLPSDIAMAVGHEALLGRCLAAAGSTECTQGLQQSSVSAELRSVLVGTASSKPTGGGGLDVNFRVRMRENWNSSPKPADWSKKRGVSYQMIHSETTYGCPIDNCVVVCCFWDLWDFHPRLNPHIDHSKKHTHTHLHLQHLSMDGTGLRYDQEHAGHIFFVKVPPLYG